MRKHRFYFTDEGGSFSGYDPQNLWIDILAQKLQVGRKLDIPLREIMAVEVKPLPRRRKTMHLVIEICGPSLEGGHPTQLLLIHKNFFGYTRVKPMQAFVDELAPLIKGNTPVTGSLMTAKAAENSKLQGQYVLNLSLLITYYHKAWYSYDKPRTILMKTITLMLIGAIANAFGVLLVRVPVDNHRMMQNFLLAGWSRSAALSVFALLTCPLFALWCFLILKWSVFER